LPLSLFQIQRNLHPEPSYLCSHCTALPSFLQWKWSFSFHISAAGFMPIGFERKENQRLSAKWPSCMLSPRDKLFSIASQICRGCFWIQYMVVAKTPPTQTGTNLGWQQRQLKGLIYQSVAQHSDTLHFWTRSLSWDGSRICASSIKQNVRNISYRKNTDVFLGNFNLDGSGGSCYHHTGISTMWFSCHRRGSRSFTTRVLDNPKAFTISQPYYNTVRRKVNKRYTIS
jgi:hypothetical protein